MANLSKVKICKRYITGQISPLDTARYIGPRPPLQEKGPMTNVPLKSLDLEVLQRKQYMMEFKMDKGQKQVSLQLSEILFHGHI